MTTQGGNPLDIFQAEAEVNKLAEEYFQSAENLTHQERNEVLKVLLSSCVDLLIEKGVFTEEDYKNRTAQNLQFLKVLKAKRESMKKLQAYDNADPEL